MTSDDLLERYVKHSAESAFSIIVKRHVDLVYSTALRRVGLPHLAEEVAQSVFIDLARQGANIKPGTPLIAWLHVVARRSAVDLVRKESRRRATERNFATLNSHAEFRNDAAPRWADIEPYLDEAVESLKPVDRAAILLRFFEDKSFRDVAKELGSSDDAAQKRVSRALEQVRRFLAKRGVHASAAGLCAGLATNAVQPAPALLGSTITAAAVGNAAAAFRLVSTISQLAMTTTHKGLAVIFFAMAVAGGIYQAQEIKRLKNDIHELRNVYEGQLGSLRAERDADKKALKAASQSLDAERLKIASLASQDPQAENALDAWLQKVVSLKKHLEQNPRYRIPEMALLEDKDWLDVTKDIQLSDDWDHRSALGALRKLAKDHFFHMVSPAMQEYLKASHGRPPDDPSAFATFMRTPVDPSIWQRYAIVQTNQISPDEYTWPGPAEIHPEWVMTDKARIDDYFDTKFYVSQNSYGTTSTGKINKELNRAWREFAAAHPNQRATNASEIAPYLRLPIDHSFVERELKRTK